MSWRLFLVGVCVIGLTACTISRKAAQTARAPVVQDQDNDGIPDAEDKCPAEPETLNGWKDADGCPDEVPPKPRIRNIDYDVNSKDIPDHAAGIIADVADLMRQYPGMRVRVEGHTDSYGTESYNLDVSRRRAYAVKKALMDKGTDGGRIETGGYGWARPIASLQTREGRKMNRRIEFIILGSWPPKEE
ncbi:OmpA family protein [bacterium]|nr:OmpA family protein [bacterium]